LHELSDKLTDQDEESIKYVAMTMYSGSSYYLSWRSYFYIVFL
jgi:hypothetical protein